MNDFNAKNMFAAFAEHLEKDLGKEVKSSYTHEEMCEYAELYHQAKVKYERLHGVVGQSEQLKPAPANMEECDLCGHINELGYDKCKGCGF